MISWYSCYDFRIMRDLMRPNPPPRHWRQPPRNTRQKRGKRKKNRRKRR